MVETDRHSDSLRLRAPVEQVEFVQVYLSPPLLTGSDEKELRFWMTDLRHNPTSSFWDNVEIKAGELRMFEELIPLLNPKPGERVLELGAGHGWSSLMLKRFHPGAEIHASEISPNALLSAEKWERLFESRLDGYWACQAGNTPFADEQFDLVFTFAAFHHFVIDDRGRDSLAEALRVTKRGGRLVLLSEPTAPAWFRNWSMRKLNRLRKGTGADVDEDCLVLSQLGRWARELGATMRVCFDTKWSWREIAFTGVLRSAAVRAVPALGWLVPVGAHVTFVRER